MSIKFHFPGGSVIFGLILFLIEFQHSVSCELTLVGFLRTRTRSPLSLGLQNLGVVLGTEWTFRECLLIDFNCMLFLLSGLGLTQYFSEALTWFWENSLLIKYSGKWLSRDVQASHPTSH